MVVTTPSFWAAKWDCQMAPFSWLNTPHCPLEIIPFRDPFTQWELQIRWGNDKLSFRWAVIKLKVKTFGILASRDVFQTKVGNCKIQLDRPCHFKEPANKILTIFSSNSCKLCTPILFTNRSSISNELIWKICCDAFKIRYQRW